LNKIVSLQVTSTTLKVDLEYVVKLSIALGLKVNGIYHMELVNSLSALEVPLETSLNTPDMV